MASGEQPQGEVKLKNIVIMGILPTIVVLGSIVLASVIVEWFGLTGAAHWIALTILLFLVYFVLQWASLPLEDWIAKRMRSRSG